MRDRVNLLLTALCLIGSGCILGEVLAWWTGRPQAGNLLGTIGLPAMWAYVVGMIVYRASRAKTNRPVTAVSKHWLPEVVGIEFSPDLLPELARSQGEILDACRTLRLQQGIASPVIRIRDDTLLASRSYAVSINGIRIFGATLGPSDDFKTQLLAALKAVWTDHADTIRFFAELRARAA